MRVLSDGEEVGILFEEVPFGEGSIRICYAADQSVLEPAMQRLERFLCSATPV